MLDFGQLAYEAYCTHTDGKSLISGALLPTWDKLDPVIREAWACAADVVKSEVERINTFN